MNKLSCINIDISLCFLSPLNDTKTSENIANQEQVKKQPSPSPSLDDVISIPREPPSGKRTHQPIILTGSKGNYLKTYACHDVEEQIVWLPKSGAKIEDSTQDIFPIY